jgi:multicomponent K+:H+ antiporter subunit G
MSTEVIGVDLPLWAQILVAALVFAGSLIALMGSVGLLRLKSYFERVHAPSIIATMGCWLIMHATWIYFSVSGQGFVMHSVLIAIFIAVTVPITTIFLMRAALFRSRRAGERAAHAQQPGAQRTPGRRRGRRGRRKACGEQSLKSCRPSLQGRRLALDWQPCSILLPSASVPAWAPCRAGGWDCG